MTKIHLLQGDCLETLRGFPDSCIDSVVTDPPYGLSKEPDMIEVVRHWLRDELHAHAVETLIAMGFAGPDARVVADRMHPPTTYEHNGRGFMGKTWDSFVPGPDVWREVLRVLKPGGHAVVFSGTRTYDLTVLAMRIAGFEIRDQLAWMYGTGFPKSHDYAADQAESKLQGVRVVRTEFVGHPQEDGFGTALKPAQEPICLARKPLIGTVAANVLEHSTGGLNIDGCRIATAENLGRRNNARAPEDGTSYVVQREAALIDNSGGLGRWPANVLMDEAAAAVLDEQSGTLQTRGNKTASRTDTDPVSCYGKYGASDCGLAANYGDSGGASRFFYCAKASKAEREAGCEHLRKASAGELTGGREEGSAGLDNPRAGAGRKAAARANTHPTVKPIALMRWLVRLVTPPGGAVLDPYMGSGSTGCAAKAEGVRLFVGCELSEEYITIAKARTDHA